METTQNPIHRSLETPTTIRLLGIRNGEDGYEYSLSHKDLENEPVYIAISYTWDHDGNEVALLIDGLETKGTENVKTILDHIYEDVEGFEGFDIGKETINVWIDQICIDQSRSHSALRERATQIKLMDRIYPSAIFVMADLGPEKSFEGFLLPLLAEKESSSWESL